MMDAVEFLKTLRRMCNCECCNCEFKKRLGVFKTCTAWRKTHPDEAVAIVEKWAKEHPVKTRQSVFLEQWPEVRINDADGLPMAIPCDLDGKLAGKCEGISCPECRKKFWLAEVEE
jgi:hypothetical protein